MPKPKSLKRNFVFIGIYSCGQEWVTLYGERGVGCGVCNHRPDDKLNDDEEGGRITVGLKHEDWTDCVSVLLHEVTEYAITRLRRSYSPTNDLYFSSDSVHFILNHEDFTAVMCNVAQFITPALPELCKAFDKEKKKHAKR